MERPKLVMFSHSSEEGDRTFPMRKSEVAFNRKLMEDAGYTVSVRDVTAEEYDEAWYQVQSDEHGLAEADRLWADR